MAQRRLAYLVCVLMLTAASPLVSKADPADTASCSGKNAVAALPEPLAKWGQILCTPYGQVITANDGWVWMQPAFHALVVIPAQPEDEDGSLAHSDAYFTKITITKGDGPDFDKAYRVFHAGFDPNEGKPAGYRVDATTVTGEVRRLYFFDYITYGWAISCPKDACDADSRFMIVNMNEEPKELPPAI